MKNAKRSAQSGKREAVSGKRQAASVLRFALGAILLAISPAIATVPDETPRVIYDCDGTTVAFTFDFPLLGTDTGQVIVRLLTVSTGVLSDPLTEAVDYTVSGVNYEYDTGGTVTTTVAYSSIYQIVIYRQTDPVQDYSVGQELNPTAFNAALDRLMVLVQEIQDYLDRTLHTSEAWPVGTSMALPSAEDRANTVLGFDSKGAPIATVGTDLLNGSLIKARWGRIVTETQTNADRMGAKAGLHLDHVYDVCDYGVIEDGATNDSSAIQVAINTASAAGGGRVYLPAGSLHIHTAISLPTGVILSGSGFYSTRLEIGADVNGIEVADSATNFGIENLYITVAEALGTNTTHAAIAFGTNNANLSFRNVYITDSASGYRTKYGVIFYSGWAGHWDNVWVHTATDYGLYMSGGQAFEFSNCDFGVATGTAAYIASNACDWAGCKFQGSGTCTGVELVGDGHSFGAPWVEVDTGTASTCWTITGGRNVITAGSHSVDAAGLHINATAGDENHFIGMKLVGGLAASIVFSGSAQYNVVEGGNVTAAMVTLGADLSNSFILPRSQNMTLFSDGADGSQLNLGHINSGIKIQTGVLADDFNEPAGILVTESGGVAPFDAFGNLIIKPKSDAGLGVQFWTGATPTYRAKVTDDGLYVGTGILASECNSVTATLDPNSMNASGDIETVLFPDTAFGDEITVVAPYDMQGILMTAYVQSAGVVKVQFYRPTASAIDLASGTYTLYQRKH